MVAFALIDIVLNLGMQVAKFSWEYGVVSEALLEWKNAPQSIWGDPFPDGKVPKLNIGDVQALSYVKGHIVTEGETLNPGNGAAGDPPSLGIPALMIGKSEQPYWDAAVRQKDHLLTVVPRWSPNGAISHREDYAELWADFVYMVPPFLAYYGVASNNVTLLKESAYQCKYYHDVLRVDGNGAWNHIAGPHTPDYALWSTGNGWAAAGMSRVLATMKKSPLAFQTVAEQGILRDYIKAILDAAIEYDTDSSNLLRNYLDDKSWWGEVSGTSILAATAFRTAKLEPATFGKSYSDWAMKKKLAVDPKINTGNGIVSPAVDPLGWHNTAKYTSGSPEGQAFVGLMYAAYRDWKG